MMYVVFIIDHIHHLMNESKILIFAYNNEYILIFLISEFNNPMWILKSMIPHKCFLLMPLLMSVP